MRYITENEVRRRFAEGTATPGDNERLTPAAAELLRTLESSTSKSSTPHPISFQPASSIPVPGPGNADSDTAKTAPAPAAHDACVCKPCIGRTHLDADTQVHKSHPRIELRGRLDTLIGVAVVVQTQFDPKNRLPETLRTGLADLKNWLWQMLCSEVSGQPLPALTVCGMPPAMLQAVCLDPMAHIGQPHVVPDAGLGPNVALLNWFRAQVRELEVLLAKTGERDDLLEAANRLSTAASVLMLLTVMAEQGREIKLVK